MKIEPLINVFSQKTALELYPDGKISASLFCAGRRILSIGRAKVSGFTEALGLSEKLRKHLANDRLSAEAESVNVIPFGCEYHVKRQWKYSGGIVEMTTDISADNGGKADALTLEEINFAGEPASVEFLINGDENIRSFSGTGTAYEGSALPLFVRVIFTDGCRAEYYCGDDFWRHCCASQYGASANHRISVSADGVLWERDVLSPAEETDVGKRPWRFKGLFSASAGDEKICMPDRAALNVSGCFASPQLHKQLRNFIRTGTDACDASLVISGSMICSDGSHVSRHGRSVPHGMLGEIFDEYIWATGAMAKKGRRFTAEVAIRELADSVICGNLALPADTISFRETEEDEA